MDDEIIVSKALRLRRRHEQILNSPDKVVEMTPRVHRSISSKSLHSVSHSHSASEQTSPHAIDEDTITTALRRLSKDEVRYRGLSWLVRCLSR